MSEVKSDIQIAREAKMQPINDILAKVAMYQMKVLHLVQWEDILPKLTWSILTH